MTTFDELQAQARGLAEEGELMAALSVYDQLFRHLEEDPDAKGDGAACHVHVGDLHRQLNQPARAFAAYQKAAELYAARGSSKEIKSLCVRMINVVPAAGDSYVRYAKLLNEHSHADAALEVLREYAEMADVEHVTDEVNSVARGSSAERANSLTRLLETLGSDSVGQSAAARRVSQDLLEAVGPADNVPPPTRTPVKPKRTTPPPRQVLRQATPPADMGNTGPARQSGIDVNWTYVGGGVGVVGIVGLVFFVASALRGGEEAPSDPVTPAIPVVSNTDSTTPTVAAETGNSTQSAPVQTAAAAPAAVTSAPDPAPSSSVDTANVVPISEPMVVESLAVQSIEQVVFRGLPGFRVVHLLDSAVEFIVESYPVDSTANSNYPIGTVIVNVVPPDTTVSIVRPNADHLVFASGVVPEDSARILIGLLRVRDPSN